MLVQQNEKKRRNEWSQIKPVASFLDWVKHHHMILVHLHIYPTWLPKFKFHNVYTWLNSQFLFLSCSCGLVLLINLGRSCITRTTILIITLQLKSIFNFHLNNTRSIIVSSFLFHIKKKIARDLKWLIARYSVFTHKRKKKKFVQNPFCV